MHTAEFHFGVYDGDVFRAAGISLTLAPHQWILPCGAKLLMPARRRLSAQPTVEDISQAAPERQPVQPNTAAYKFAWLIFIAFRHAARSDALFFWRQANSAVGGMQG